MEENTLNLRSFEPQEFYIQFIDVENNNEPLGKFFTKDGKLSFEGKVDESADIFVNAILHNFNSKINCNCQE